MDYNNFGNSASKKFQDDTLNRVRKEHEEALKSCEKRTSVQTRQNWETRSTIEHRKG